ncbi:M28 family metallopeptidase [bacterium]|nr:M28 family metallopeptidase [bacterium]
MKRIVILFLFLANILFADEASNSALAVITKERLQTHINFLSHDLLEGRGTATRGYDIAAMYVASQFEQLGLYPGATKSSYFQNVPLRKTDIVAEKMSLAVITKEGTHDLTYSTDFLMPPDYIREETSVTADVVFAGFGITAPDLKYDDYSGVDTKGKIVLLLSGAPDTFPISERAHYSSTNTKQKNAVAHGAAGIISFQNPEDEKRSPWERSIRQSKLSGYRWMETSGVPHDVPEQIKTTANLSHSGAEKLLSRSPHSIEEVFQMWKEKKVKSFPLNLQASLKKVSRLDAAMSPNVVGWMEGSDPELKREYIVYTAHLDHLGISDPVKNDTINNGAYDNATGIACLIEVARAFTALKVKPRRSLLFIAVTAEEKGLQGSDYFAHNPTVPINSIVANVNTDMFLMLFPFSDAVALGAEHSSLGPIADRAFQTVGIKRSPDPAPEEVRFVRSDQYSFIKKGIPAIKLMAGFESQDPSVNGADKTREWLRTIYHSPQDENSQEMHWESGIKIVQLTFLIGYETANEIARPTWNKGDFFGRTFGKAGASP